MKDKREQAALITGASKGIGAALAVAFAKAGYGMIGINYMGDEEGAKQVAAQVEQAGARALMMQADVGNRTACQGMVRQFIDHFGRIDVLINNAGGALRIPEGGFADMPMDYWESQINLNLNAAAYASQVALGDMIAKGIRGRIINISSVHGTVTWVKRKMLPYCAAKAGLDMFTRMLAIEAIPHGIVVNGIAPGFIQTKATTRYDADELAAFKRKIPARRLGTVDDITPLALFLADEDTVGFIVGQTILADGGQAMDGVIDSIVKDG